METLTKLSMDKRDCITSQIKNDSKILTEHSVKIMVHDVYLKMCGEQASKKCIKGASCKHTIVAHYSIPFVFSFPEYSVFWSIHVAHGKKVSTVLKRLDYMINEVKIRVTTIKTEPGKPTMANFLDFLLAVRKWMEPYPDATFLSDQCLETDGKEI